MRDMKVEYRLLNDIVAKLLMAKVGSFDVVTTERLDIMVAVTVGIKINWAHVLFHILAAMVSMPGNQSYGYGVQLSLLLEKLVKADPGESVALHPLKVLNTKSVHTYKLQKQASVKLESATKQPGEKASKAAEPKKKKTFSDSVERPLATIATIRPNCPCPKRKMVLASSDFESTTYMEPHVPMKKPHSQRPKKVKLLRAIPTGADQAFIPEISEE
ncbi:hypothetical protein F511_19077 [Dorcoceras hygrometricum]|uniref:Uncharacterized protein n=1 Tax=Dorcoceras hygrometricum TaxID=472368 RepID=A0A2Z7D7T2_9LAMI|nr:hypothetical protein F511_19077 [Dorcoceras hygrometricum]